jgi:hypothetical protein
VFCQSSSQPITFLSSKFIQNNVSGNNGGGAVSANGCSNLTFSSCIFSRNLALFGGAYYSETTYSTISSSVFEYNYAQSGSGIYVADNSVLSISNSNFNNNGYNSSYGTGAAISAAGISSDKTSVSISYSSFSGNVAGEGSGVYTSSISRLSISHSNFTNNVALYDAGALCVVNVTSMTSSWNLFSGNSGTSSGRGGAVLISSSSANITSDQYQNNTNNKGGAIYANSPLNLNITSSFFSANSASYVGGGFCGSGLTSAFIYNTTVSFFVFFFIPWFCMIL